MTAPENSLSRWSRLKREAGSKSRPAADHDDAPACLAGSQETPPETALDERRLDAEALRSIDAITVDTDIRAFLRSRMPAELTRAALRRAWTSDPAIRDFVGIAENQWDFNDPSAISGFGPMLESDDLPALLAHAFGQPAEVVTAIAELPMALGARAPVEIVAEIATPDQPDIPDASNGAADEPTAITQPVAEPDAAPSKRRTHGGAMPR